eukprot:7120476-Alexandrium_andersonii.AAC.1
MLQLTPFFVQHRGVEWAPESLQVRLSRGGCCKGLGVFESSKSDCASAPSAPSSEGAPSKPSKPPRDDCSHCKLEPSTLEAAPSIGLPSPPMVAPAAPDGGTGDPPAGDAEAGV